MSDQPTPEPPRAHNVAALDKLIKQISGAILADINLRKWCVEQALLVKLGDPVALADQIYRFITKGPADVAGEKPNG